MNELLRNVKVLIWDFDGTLYRQQQGLWDQIRESECRVIMDRLGWTHEKAIREFVKVHNVITPSGTQAVALITKISMKEAAIETAKYVDYTNYLQPDPKLTIMFTKLQSFRHFMLVNGTQASVASGLSLLHVDPMIFEEIVTAEVVGETKPSQKGFSHILSKTLLPPQSHMMVGDRLDVDLVPAKAMGFRTALVWETESRDVADITLTTVYEIADVVA